MFYEFLLNSCLDVEKVLTRSIALSSIFGSFIIFFDKEMSDLKLHIFINIFTIYIITYKMSFIRFDY